MVILCKFKKDEEVIENKADEQFIPFKKLILERRVHKCPEEKPFELKSNELLHEKSKSCKNTMFEKLEHNLINSNTQKHEGGIIEKNEEIEDILAEIDNKSIIVI